LFGSFRLDFHKKQTKLGSEGVLFHVEYRRSSFRNLLFEEHGFSLSSTGVFRIPPRRALTSKSSPSDYGMVYLCFRGGSPSDRQLVPL